ncbi:CidA/LrgA family protein [Enterobacteriaceae bacterium LUAb1]
MYLVPGTGRFLWLKSLQVPVQLVFYSALFTLSEQLTDWLHLPLPGNIVGMLLLLMLIAMNIIPLRWVQAGAYWLLAEMLLFFVPAVVAVVNYVPLLRVEGWRIFLVIAFSTLLVLGTTALVVDQAYRFELWLSQRAKQKQDKNA